MPICQIFKDKKQTKLFYIDTLCFFMTLLTHITTIQRTAHCTFIRGLISTMKSLLFQFKKDIHRWNRIFDEEIDWVLQQQQHNSATRWLPCYFSTLHFFFTLTSWNTTLGNFKTGRVVLLNDFSNPYNGLARVLSLLRFEWTVKS